jgi:hypothetical protein
VLGGGEAASGHPETGAEPVAAPADGE